MMLDAATDADLAGADAPGSEQAPGQAEAVDGRRPSRRRRRLPRWARLVAALLIAALLAAAVWAVWFSALLSVRQVRVIGVDDPAASRAALAAAQVPVGIPLARVDTAAAQARVADLDWVQGVDIRRGWPSEVVVAVTPRVPVAKVTGNAAGASGLVVDEQGVAFAPVGTVERGLPNVAAAGPALVAATQVLVELPDRLRARLEGIKATTVDDVTLTLRSGDLVRWGSPEESARKAEVLDALMQLKADVYDVSSPETPTTFRGR
jgi:cell division protein FtsQ